MHSNAGKSVGRRVEERAATTASPEPIGGFASARIHLDLLRHPLETFEAMAARGDRVAVIAVPFRPGARRVVFAFGREANRAILSDPETFRTTGQGLSGPRGSALRRIRNGLTRTRGERHRFLRALLLPKLQRRAVDAMAPRIASILDEQLVGWQPGTTIDLGRETKTLSLRIASELLFGIEDRDRAVRFGALLGEFMRRSYRLDVLATRWLGAVPGSPYAGLEGLAGRLDAEARSLIALRRRGRGGEDLLTALIEARDAGGLGLDDDDLVGQVTLLFGASYETTAQALLFSLVLLAQAPREALALRSAQTSSGAEMGAEARANIVRESLRLLPPVPYTIRIARRDTLLEGVAIRRSDRVLVSHFQAHRLAECFPDPERFRPERWRDARPGPYDYFPFSAAPRICIGAGFASEVLEQAVGEIVRRFDFRLPEGLRIDPTVRVTLGPRAAVPLELAAPTGTFRRARLSGELARWIDRATGEADGAPRP
jgi:cytochrome P450